MVLIALIFHFAIITLQLLLKKRVLIGNTLQFARIMFYGFYLFVWNSTKPFIIFKLLSFNAIDIIFLKFTAFLLLISTIHSLSSKAKTMKLELLYMLVIIFMMAKGALLFYVSSIFFIIFYMLWMIENRSLVSVSKIYYFVILIFLNLFLLVFSFVVSDRLFIESFSYPYSLIIALLLTILLFFFMFIIEDIYSICIKNKENIENVAVTFVLFVAPFLFKYSILYVHQINLLLQINSYIYQLVGIFIFVFALLLFIKSLNGSIIGKSIFILYLLHILNFLGVAVLLYGERYSEVFIQIFLYLTLLQYLYLVMQEDIRQKKKLISYVLVIMLFMILPPSPIFAMTIKYVELLYKFSSLSAIIWSLLSVLLIFITGIRLLKENLDITPEYFTGLAKQSLYLITVIVGYVFFIR